MTGLDVIALDTPLLTLFNWYIFIFNVIKQKKQNSYLDEYLIDEIRSVNLLNLG